MGARKNRLIKKCVICQQPFVAKNKKQITCSKRCGKIRHTSISLLSQKRTKLIELGISFNEENLEEVYMAHIGQKEAEARREREEKSDYYAELRAHHEFRESIQPETLAEDEAEARRLGMSYGYYIATRKGKNEGNNTKS